MFSTQIEFWTPSRTRLLIRILVLLQLLGIAVHQIAEAMSGVTILDGDFPTFYIGGWLALHNPAHLYDIELNKLLQNTTWPALAGKFAPFVYPPAYGLFLAPLGFFTPNQARIIFVVFHVLCFLAAAAMLQKLAPKKDVHEPKYLDLLCFLLLFAPLTAGLFGCQNSAFSLLLYSAILFLVPRDDNRSDFFAGLACGLWFFKPQYPALLLFGMICARRWRFVCGAAAGGILMYAASAAQAGWDWPIIWAATVKEVQTIELYNNTYQYCSLSGVLTAAAVALNLHSFVPAIQLIATVIFFAGAGWCGIMFYRAGRISSPDERNERLFKLLLLTGPLALLLSPHSHFYDLVLCIPAGLVWLPVRTDREISKIAAILLFVMYFSSHRQGLPVSPLILTVLLTLWIGVKKLHSPLHSPGAAPSPSS